MVNRIPRAAKVLTAEIKSILPDAQFTSDGLDGLGVYRVLTIGPLSADLGGLLLADKRISSVSAEGDSLSVTFVSDSRADSTGPFGADLVLKILTTEDSGLPEVVAEQIEEEPVVPTKKPTRKKAEPVE